MNSSANAFHAISHLIPEEIHQGLKSVPMDELCLDNLVRLISGARPSPYSRIDLGAEWLEKQNSIISVLSPLCQSNIKRPLEQPDPDISNKRPRTSPPEIESPTVADAGRSVYSLKPISATAPVRKKIEIDIRESAIVILNSTTQIPEGPPIPLSILRRAFLLPTRGKTKPHWTVVILSSDYQLTTGRGKQSTADEKPQIIFGIDAILAAPLQVTSYDTERKATVTTHAKNEESLPVLRQLFDQLPIPVLEPSPSVFKSAVPGLYKSANPDGVPGIEAYRSTKPGNLWFMREGILWGESKPCKFWPVEDFMGKTEGLKIIGGIGKTCSVILTRISRHTSKAIDGLEDPGEETEFSMVDSKEKEGIKKWVQQHQHSFNTAGDGGSSTERNASEPKVVSTGPLTIHNLGDANDSSDEDFTASTDDDSNLSTSDSDSGDSEGANDDEAEESEGENASTKSGVSGEEGEEELGSEHHPILHLERFPRVSKAAMDMAITMVVDDMVGGNDEEDELID